ncbi:hypothetical protein ATANTOWER_017839 [Ataeniobius toweri]|uniref:Uncharacterized protein n=1 Tax=Ataeniobius toweri TaxID=208326 RepID=A0ABU7AQU3_9TELE|nr:hypothetical protein [Ataeniobius toweri]
MRRTRGTLLKVTKITALKLNESPVGGDSLVCLCSGLLWHNGYFVCLCTSSGQLYQSGENIQFSNCAAGSLYRSAYSQVTVWYKYLFSQFVTLHIQSVVLRLYAIDQQYCM